MKLEEPILLPWQAPFLSPPPSCFFFPYVCLTSVLAVTLLCELQCFLPFYHVRNWAKGEKKKILYFSARVMNSRTSPRDGIWHGQIWNMGGGKSENEAGVEQD